MFKVGFEKVAVSARWAMKRMSSGLSSRTGESVKNIHKASLKSYKKTFQNATGLGRSEATKALGKPIHKPLKSLFRDMLENINVSIPKK